MSDYSNGSKYYAVNDRPVMILVLPSGEMDVLVMNMRTGEFERNFDYAEQLDQPFKDVDQFTEEKFNAYVEQLRQQIAQENETEHM
jgi:hypothetical protein